MTEARAEDDLAKLQRLLRAHHPCISMVTSEEQHALDLVRAAALSAGLRLRTWSATRGLTDGAGPLVDSTGQDETLHAAAAFVQLAREVDQSVLGVAFDLAGHLNDARTVRAVREAIEVFRDRGRSLVLIDHEDTLPAVLASLATPLEVSLPDDKEIEHIIRNTIQRLSVTRPITARLSRRELATAVRNLHGLTRVQAEQIIVDCVIEDHTFTAEDINTILAHKRKRLHYDGTLEYVQSPISLDDIGGLRRLKTWLKHREGSFDERAVEFGLQPPRGVLLLGVQGAGKSLSAKAIAAAWQQPLLRLDPGRLYDRYIGESERKLRSALRQAEAMAPIVLWIDEIEKGFASVGSNANDGGLSQRMFGTLLTWMQEHTKAVFLIATANNIDALPPELLRKGRFDEIFFVDLPSEEVRRDIFAIHLRRRHRDPEQFDLETLAAAALGYSGAEIEQAIVAALHAAFADGGDIDTARVVQAIAESPPLSVTMAERLDRLRAWAQDRCVPAD